MVVGVRMRTILGGEAGAEEASLNDASKRDYTFSTVPVVCSTFL